MSDFTTGKSVFVLAIVAGCFAILWPNVFYPMLQGPPLESVEREHMHQERPPHLRPEFLHPALREKGSAIPQSHVVPKIVKEGRPGPIPGLRPPMGGAGHVVSPPKGGSTMGIVMPMYTIGIVVFFLYTMMKLLFKKSEVTTSYEMSPDPEFRHSVFGEGCNNTFVNGKEAFDDSKLGWRERDTRDLELDLLKKRLQETEKAMERIVAKMMSLPNNIEQSEVPSKSEVQTEADEFRNKTDDVVDEKIATKLPDEFEAEIWNNSGEEDEAGKGTVKVVGMELTERCEKQGKWSRPPTPQSRPTTPQNFYITGPLSQKSKFLVSDSHTETDPADDNAIVLTGKVTLSLIGLDNDEKDITDSEAGGR